MIIEKHTPDFNQYDPFRFLGLQEYFNSDIDVYMGHIWDTQVNKDKFSVYIDFEQPNRWFNPISLRQAYESESKFDKILCNCPYISEWRNSILGKEKYKSVYIPTNIKFVTHNKKEIDIIYTGHVNPHQNGMINQIRQFNHQIVSGSGSSYIQKLEEISKSKITLVHNLLFLDSNVHHVVKNIPESNNNIGFTNILTNINSSVSPQLKTRLFEAAMCKSLILCKRDSWNVIENYFSLDEFVYFNNDEDLPYIIKSILNNYDHFTPMIDKAFNKYLNNYTSEHFVKDFLHE